MSFDEKVTDNDDDSWVKIDDRSFLSTPPKNSHIVSVSPSNFVLNSSMQECLLDALREGGSTPPNSISSHVDANEMPVQAAHSILEAPIMPDNLSDNVFGAEQELANLEWNWNWSSRPEASSPISVSTWQSKMKHYKLVDRSTNTSNSFKQSAAASLSGYQSEVDVDVGYKIKQSNVDGCPSPVIESVTKYENEGRNSITFILVTHACSFLIGVSIAFLYFRRYNENVTCHNI